MSTMLVEPHPPADVTPSVRGSVSDAGGEPMEVDAQADGQADGQADEAKVPVKVEMVEAPAASEPVRSEDEPMEPVADAASPSTKPTANTRVDRPVESVEAARRRATALATRRLELQVQFVENARRKVQDESHPDMATLLAVLAAEREHTLAVAQLRAEQFEQSTEGIFAYECDEANAEFELQCEKLRQEMLEEIHNEMEIINDQRKGGGASSARKTSRNTRSSRTKPEVAAFAFDTAQKIKKRAGSVFQPLENRLAQTEVDHDLRELTATYEASKKRRVDSGAEAESLPLVKHHRAKLLYREWIFQEGDEVYVMNYPASSEYVAVICAITPMEVCVLSEKGKFCRLVIMDLRHGRVVLTTLAEHGARDDESASS